MISRPALHLLASSLVALAALSTPARAEIMAPAASLAGVNTSIDNRYSTPLVGEPLLCNNIERRVAVINPRVVVGEPVIFRFLLRCMTPHRSTEFMGNLAFGNDVRVLVIPGSPLRIQPYEYFGVPRGSTGATATLDMEGISYYRIDFKMAYDGDTVSGAAFERPGVYRLDIRHNCLVPGSAPAPASMGTFDITVEPAEGDDARALELLNELNAFRAIQLMAARDIDRQFLLNDRLAERFQRVITELPNARLRPYCAFVLADYHLHHQRNDEAIALYEMLMTDYPDTPHHEAAAYQLVPLYRLFRSFEASQELYHSLWADPVATQLIHPRSENHKRFVEPWLLDVANVGGQWMLWQTPGPDPELGEEVEGPTFILDEDIQRAFGLPERLTPEIYRQLMQERGLTP